MTKISYLWFPPRPPPVAPVRRRKGHPSVAGFSCYTGTWGTQGLARASRRYLNLGPKSRRWSPTQHHKKVVGRAQLEEPPSEALSHVHRTTQEQDDSLGYSRTILWPLSTRGGEMPILQFRKTETGKISREWTSSRRIWGPRLLRSWVGKDWRQNLRIPDYFGGSHITFDSLSMQKVLLHQS